MFDKFRKKVPYFNMKKAKLIGRSIVLLDNIYSNLSLNKFQEILIDVKNPFELLANNLVLKSIFGKNVIEGKNSNPSHKEFGCDGISFIYDFFPPRIMIKAEEKDILDITNKIISFADINDKIGKIGMNYEFFLEQDLKIKDFLLQDKFSKEFSTLSTTLILKIDENISLNLKIAEATLNTQDGIYFEANFNNIVNQDNDILTILNKDFLSLATSKIESVLKID